MVRAYQTWSDAEVSFILEHYESLSITQIAEKLEKPSKSVSSKIKYLRNRKVLPPGKQREHRNYSHEELECLRVYAGTMPMPKLTKVWNSMAAKRGWPLRTLRSLEAKIIRLGESTAPEAGYLNAASLAAAMGCSETTIKGWILSKKLPATKDYGAVTSPWRIRNEDFVRFALTHPEEVAKKLSQEGFCWLLLLIAEVKLKNRKSVGASNAL